MVIQFFTTAFTLENIKIFLNDQRGALILPIDGITIEDKDWIKYKSLKLNNHLESINPDDLPSDFCEDACKLVDEFRRKTADEKVEWMLYFDYKTGDVIYCWEGEIGKCGGDFKRVHFEGRSISSIHNHSRDYYSFPSPDNFDILENDFEDYEIIASRNAFWIVEFKGYVASIIREKFQTNLSIEFKKIENEIKLMYNDKFAIRHNIEYACSNYLQDCIDKTLGNIELNMLKKEFN